MVTNVTSLTGNGLKDWLIQRVTAVYFLVYSVYLLVYLLVHQQLDFSQWHALFHNTWFQIASLLALFALSLHAWIGIWTVATDYLKSTALRLLVHAIVMLWLLGQFVWGLKIMWGQ